MFATHPDMAKEWAAHTPDFSKLPDKVKKKKKADTATVVKGLQHDILPAVLAGTIGAGYGAFQAPGGSPARGAVIGGMGGLGLGAGMAAGNAFLESPISRNIEASGVKSAIPLAGGMVGLGGGLALGRETAEHAHLGNPKDRFVDDLEEIDPAQKGFAMLPEYLREYVPGQHKRASDADGEKNVVAVSSEKGTRITPCKEVSSEVMSELDRIVGSAKKAEMPPVDLPTGLASHGAAAAGGAAGGAALAGASMGLLPFIYGFASSPKGRGMHGGASTMAQTNGTVGGALAGGGLGALGGGALAAYLGQDPANGAMLGGGLGAGLGAYGGHALSKSMYPGPEQLGLGDKTAALGSKKEYKVQYPWTLSLSNGKSTIQRPTIGKAVPGMQSLPNTKPKSPPKADNEAEAKKVPESAMAPKTPPKGGNKVASMEVGERIQVSHPTTPKGGLHPMAPDALMGVAGKRINALADKEPEQLPCDKLAGAREMLTSLLGKAKALPGQAMTAGRKALLPTAVAGGVGGGMYAGRDYLSGKANLPEDITKGLTPMFSPKAPAGPNTSSIGYQVGAAGYDPAKLPALKQDANYTQGHMAYNKAQYGQPQTPQPTPGSGPNVPSPSVVTPPLNGAAAGAGAAAKPAPGLLDQIVGAYQSMPEGLQYGLPIGAGLYGLSRMMAPKKKEQPMQQQLPYQQMPQMMPQMSGGGGRMLLTGF